MKKVLTILAFCVFFTEVVFAQTEMPRLAIPTAQSNGFGGTHTAYTDNVFALLVNPAAIVRVEQRSFFALSPTLFSPQSTFDILPSMIDVIDGDTGALGDAASVLKERNGKIALGLDMREFPFSIAWVADGFGFGLWNRTFINPSIQGEWVDINVYADVMVPVGFGFKILERESHSVDAGITVKPFIRAIAHEKAKITELMDDNYDFIDNLSAPLIAGAGLDVGFLYRWDIGLQAGLTLDDIITRGGLISKLVGKDDISDSYYVPFTMNLGVAYDLRIGRVWENAPSFLARSGVAFAFDWRDIISTFQQDDYQKRNAQLNIGLGMEISLIDIFKIRLGMSEMLPAFGIGVDLGTFKFDAAYYGKEFGLEPGQLSAAALDLTIAIRPGAKKRDWPWTRRSLVGLLGGPEEVSAEESAENE
jgi:hypothetical protein